MHDKKIIKFLEIFIIVQPLYDVLIYFFNSFNINIPLISVIRPLIAFIIYLIILFGFNVKKKYKVGSIIYLSLYSLFCVFHLINIKNNFFELSYGSAISEIRYLFDYGYFLLQFINFYIIFKMANEKEKKALLTSVIYAVLLMTVLYFLSIITRTSPKTYTYSLVKEGWKGWSISSHYVGHAIIYSLPIIIYGIFEKKYIKKWYKYLILVFIVSVPFYFVGTKASLVFSFIIIAFYTLVSIISCIKEKKVNTDTIFLIVLCIILTFTFRLTFGYDNFKYQLDVSNGDDIGTHLINDNLNGESSFSVYNGNGKAPKLDKFEDRIKFTFYKYKDIKSSVFDNRTIQKVLNKYLWSISPVNDKLLGYGHETMPNCTWVETDVHTIFYCYGIVGFILILLVPIGFIALNGIKCLINYRELNSEKIILGLGYAISLVMLYYIGYTMQFAQTIFYLVMLFVVSNSAFTEEKSEKITKDYLFMINDLNIGGAEVGMVDVVNELVAQGKKVDIVLLRKRGPLLKKLSKKITVYEILSSDYSNIKRKIYHVLYMLGGPFTKYVYRKTINCNYKSEIAYLEGYPAVFIASSNNEDSIKIASIRVGLKNHKLKASKFPWGEYLVKNAYKKIDKIYTVSNLTTNEFLEKYPFCKNKTKTIYTYFNVEEIRKKSMEKYDFKYDKSKINFLAVGRFNTQKGYDRLIEAFDIVVKKNNNVMLHFLGNYDTLDGKKVLELIKEKKLEDKVVLHGTIDNPYPYIKDCDALVSSSLYEGFPRVINEAISLRKLCIGTNVTGTKEALHSGELGILVEDSVNGLVKGMNEYIENPRIYNNYKASISKYDGNKESFFKEFSDITKKKKKMIIYMPKLSFGGMEKALVNLINYAKLNKKYDLSLYLIYKGEMNYMDLLPDDIKVIVACKGKWNIFGKVVATINIVFRYIYQVFNKYDIAICYSYQHPILTSLTRFSSKNSIVYIHGNLEDGIDKKILKKRLKKCKYDKFAKIICVSNNAKNVLVKYIKNEKNIYVVNNIIDGDSILEKSKEKVEDFKFLKNKVYFVSICRHYENAKRLTRIIEATKRLNEEGYKFEVLFIGDGEDHSLYEDIIKKYNIKNIHLMGKKKNPYKYLIHANALVLSSIREGYPVVFIESLILNKPIITTNVSDAKKDIEGKYGIVVDNNDNSIYYGMKEFLEKGYEIKNKFDYVKFNKKIESLVDTIYEKD